jgi:hypothetical protein
MQILNPGKHMNGEWTGKFVCTNHGNGNQGCDAELEITKSDLYQAHSSSMGESSYYVSFLCPCCGAETDLSNSDGYRHVDLPSSIHARGLPACNRSQVKTAQASIASGSYISPREVPR